MATSAKATVRSVSRTGNKFSISWTNPSGTTEVRIQYRRQENGNWESWPSTWTTPDSNTSHDVSINFGNYDPAGSNHLTGIQFRIRIKQGSKSYSYQYENTSIYLWKPSAPSLSAPTEGTSSTSFPYSVSSSDSRQAFTKFYYKTAVANGVWDISTYNGAWNSLVESSSASGTISVGRGAAGTTEAVTVLVKANAGGPAGLSGIVGQRCIYNIPLAATNLSASIRSDAGGIYLVSASWTQNKTVANPTKAHQIQWCIGNPINTSLAPPNSWYDGESIVNDRTTTTAQDALFYTDGLIGDEQCLWVRVWQILIDNLKTVSNWVLVKEFDYLKSPTIDSITYNASTGLFSVSVTQNSSLPVETRVSIGQATVAIGAGNSSWTGTLWLNGQGYTASAYNVYGRKQSVIGAQGSQMAFDPRRDADSPIPYTPRNVNVIAINNAGTVKITWDNFMLGVESATVKWGTSLDAMTSSETFYGANIREASISNLNYETTYYFKVATTNSKGTSGDSSYDSITLSVSDVSPTIMAVDDRATGSIAVSWDWNEWDYATGIDILYSTDPSEYQYQDAKWDSQTKATASAGAYYIRNLERGHTYYVWARYAIASGQRTKAAMATVPLPVEIITPTITAFERIAQASDAQGETTVRIAWKNSTNGAINDATGAIVSWDTSESAWSTLNGPANKSDQLDISQTEAIIDKLELGRTWYARVRYLYNDKWYKDSEEIASCDLRTTPLVYGVTVSPKIATRSGGHVDVSWKYSNEDGSEQEEAIVTLYDSEKQMLENGIIRVNGKENAVMFYPSDYDMGAFNNYYVTVQTKSANQIDSNISDYEGFTVIDKPIAIIESTSLIDVVIDEGEETEHTIHTLQDMPLTMTISGVENGGQASVYVERLDAQFINRPDESAPTGFEGELAAVVQSERGEGSITITQNDLRALIDDYGKYRITVIITNRNGVKSDPTTLDFTCMWAEHAVMPLADYVVDSENRIVKITPHDGQGTTQDSYFEIYRLSADRPELILRSADWDTTFVDPYPTLGEYGGHRIVCRTATGNYMGVDGNGDSYYAWLDIEEPTLDAGKMALVNFDGNQISFNYNVDVSHAWDKDFTETKYLGGSVQGDWNASVSRKTSIGTVMITLIDADKIELMRKLATYTGVCHVRTPDGSSFPADVQVSESWTHDRGYKVVDFSMEITRIDSDAQEMITLAEWEADNELV